MDFIFDIDDTISNDEHRSHFLSGESKNWKTYYSKLIDDETIAPSITILKSLYEQGHNIILCTGRPEEYRDLTVSWLEKHDVPAHDLFMRLPKDGHVKNAEVKRIMISRVKEAGYNPVAVFEDNPNSVAMWKSLGLVVYQVA